MTLDLPATKRFSADGKINPRWRVHYLEKMITLAKHAELGPDACVFAIGSCFAEYIRYALSDLGLDVTPDYDTIPLDADRYRIDTIPDRYHMNFYSIFAIRQELERAIGEWSQSRDDYWTVRDKHFGGDVMYQDPYRRLVVGKTPEDLFEAIEHINVAVRNGLKKANVFFMTFGMAEVFINKSSGLVVCQKPGYAGGGGKVETTYHMSSYAENLENLKRSAEIIRSINPEARIFVTVSPVPLERTFSDNDIVVANCEGKSILRAVVGQADRDIEGVSYFPAYEFVTSNGLAAFQDRDGRHVEHEVVSLIMQGFKAASSP